MATAEEVRPTRATGRERGLTPAGYERLRTFWASRDVPIPTGGITLILGKNHPLEIKPGPEGKWLARLPEVPKYRLDKYSGDGEVEWVEVPKYGILLIKRRDLLSTAKDTGVGVVGTAVHMTVPVEIDDVNFSDLREEHAIFSFKAGGVVSVCNLDIHYGTAVPTAAGEELGVETETAEDESPAWRLLQTVLGGGEGDRLALAARHFGKTEVEVTGGEIALFYADLVTLIDERDIPAGIPGIADITAETAKEVILEALRGLATTAEDLRLIGILPGDADADNQLLRFLVAVKRAKGEELLALAGRVLKVKFPEETDLIQFYADAVETAIAAGARLQ